ncbi:MAG: esterase [Blautia sp.]|nr:esterase [Blautia sp.]
MKKYGNPDASVVLIQMVDDHDLEGIESEAEEIKKLTKADFCLTPIKVKSWNQDLAPWPSPAVFGKEYFGNGAADTLSGVLELCTDQTKKYIIGGYSLAGLFALWAVYQTDVFIGAAAASPSVWYPGFVDYMRENSIHADHVYLSLGDREEKTRNAVMAAVGDRIREIYALLQNQNIHTTLEWNQGNHFRDADIRTAKAFAWVMKNQK